MKVFTPRKLTRIIAFANHLSDCNAIPLINYDTVLTEMEIYRVYIGPCICYSIKMPLIVANKYKVAKVAYLFTVRSVLDDLNNYSVRSSEHVSSCRI